MKSVHVALCTLLLSPTLTAYASRQILPAGSLISCTVSETKISSKTTAIGDPVLCQAGMSTRNGSARLPFNTYLEGRFEDYRDPGHFVGKGWMELKFDRMVIEPRTVIPRVGESGGCARFRCGSRGKDPRQRPPHARHRGVVDSDSVGDRPAEPATARGEHAPGDRDA